MEKLSCINWSHKFYYFEIMKKFILAYVKSRETGDYLKLKTGVELKLLERKLDFWNLFENWSLKNYLKIGVLGIKFKNWNFGRII